MKTRCSLYTVRYEEGLKANLTRELSDLRDQQANINTNLEQVMDRVDTLQQEDKEDSELSVARSVCLCLTVSFSLTHILTHTHSRVCVLCMCESVCVSVSVSVCECVCVSVCMRVCVCVCECV